MAKPWAKYEVGFINHDKFKALPSNAICLWLEGKDYADDKLTDGLLPHYAVKLFRFFSKRNVALLTTSIGPKHDGAQVFAPLWEPHAVGFKMHDYLDHNECREVVRQRIDRAEAAKQGDRDRKTAARAAKETKRVARVRAEIRSVSGGVSGSVSEKNAGQHPGQMSDFQGLSGSNQNTDPSTPPNPPHGGLLVGDRALGEKARIFLERVPVIYAKVRSGAMYHVREARDFPYVLEMVSDWPDVDYLCDMYEVFLRKVEWKPKNQPGSPGQFKFMAPECDALLRQSGWHRVPKASL